MLCLNDFVKENRARFPRFVMQVVSSSHLPFVQDFKRKRKKERERETKLRCLKIQPVQEQSEPTREAPQGAVYPSLMQLHQHILAVQQPLLDRLRVVAPREVPLHFILLGIDLSP